VPALCSLIVVGYGENVQILSKNPRYL